MVSEAVVELSRWQFAVSISYHFLFVPLTVGLSFILAIMESTYVITGREIYKDMTLFWGKLFGINCAVGLVTGFIMAFQLGMNWSFFSHYVGDIMGAPVVMLSLIGFILEASFVSLFFFGWDKLTKNQHLIITWLVAFGANFSVLWVLIANGWMQNPVGAVFNYETMRMELSSFAEVIFNPIAQVKVVHTLAAGYVTASSFVLAVSAYYLLKGRDIAFSQRSYTIAASFGLASVLSVIFLGGESGYTMGQLQKAKLAAIDSEWSTEEPPAAFTVIGIPEQDLMIIRDAMQVPWLLGLIGTHSLDKPVIGLTKIMVYNRRRIINGIKAHGLLQQLRKGEQNKSVTKAFDSFKNDLGYGLLLKRYTENISNATDYHIALAVKDSIPPVKPVFWAFRLMIVCGCIALLTFFIAVISSLHRKQPKNWILRVSLYTLPIPWVASESGWVVSEFGRQPWLIADVLPSFLGSSLLTEWDLIISFSSYVIFYSVLFIMVITMMMKTINLGPSSLHKSRYHFEANEGNLL